MCHYDNEETSPTFPLPKRNLQSTEKNDDELYDCCVICHCNHITGKHNCFCECQITDTNSKYVDVKIKEHCDVFDEEEIKAIKRGNIVSFAFENYWIFFCPMCGKKLEVDS